MTINKHILSYIAGYFDGDGCFSIREENIQNRSKYLAQFIVISTNKIVLQFIKKYIGGSITIGSKREQFPNQKIQYRFCICGKRSADIAEIILPFLIEKKKQCQCYIQFTRTKCKNKKKLLLKKMKKLKTSCDLITKDDTDSLKKIKRTRKTKTYDFSYLAGFIDAECSLGIYRYRSKNRENFLYKTTFQLNNTKYPCFFFLMSRFGGSVSYVPPKRKKRAQISWKLSSKALHDILPKIYPFLVTKKPVCEELINFRKLVLKNGGARHTRSFKESYKCNLIERDRIFHYVHQLNHRGFLSI